VGLATVFLVVSRAIELSVVLLWPLSAAWVAVDAARRVRNRGQRRLALGVAVLLPFLGALAYRAFRPPELLIDRRLREVERKLAGTQERRAAAACCPSCREHVAPDFRACPHCGTNLRRACAGCGETLDLLWACCPWCETDVDAVPLPGRERPPEPSAPALPAAAAHTASAA
jgi:hypothetical protein